VVLISNFKPRGGLSINVFARDGDQLDLANSRLGEELRVRPTIEWNVNRHLLLRVQHTAARFDTAGGERIFKADLTDLRVTWQFNLRSFVRFTSQRQLVRRNVAVYLDPSTESETLTLGTQLLYSYKLNPQTVLFVGYSDNAREDDEVADLTRTDRTVFAKLSYAWLR
jgi:chemotaxis methyl-accepting protein methylase